jgi:hypothetical protein
MDEGKSRDKNQERLGNEKRMRENLNPNSSKKC